MDDKENMQEQQGSLADGLGQKIVEALSQNQDMDLDKFTVSQEQSPAPLPQNKVSKAQAINIACENYVLSDNITRLIQLVAGLPNDIPKQTGANIIKQTMESMGVSMKTLMTEAKQVQENINTNVRTSLSDIEEAKATIKNIETQITSYKQLSQELNDILGLFIVSDKEL